MHGEVTAQVQPPPPPLPHCEREDGGAKRGSDTSLSPRGITRGAKGREGQDAMQSAMKTRPRRVSTGEAQQSAGGGHCSGSLVLSGRGAQAEGCRSGFNNQFAQPPQVDRHARGEAGGSLHPYEICSFTMQQDRVIFEAGSLAEVKWQECDRFCACRACLACRPTRV